ncbi:hypothetical protein [Parachlamydia sp. AcF125]|uniref:hypothetical protein n=1 Tax=Parachlamydia sp. AcF125 TaxID=2795736 RepID=UPI001BC9AD91|nr:hypothetical protein [Parachlamydia sp. AcF125]MBS4167599.1 hypothetical protein [Parachlamydia sp. AcF125]
MANTTPIDAKYFLEISKNSSSHERTSSSDKVLVYRGKTFEVINKDPKDPKFKKAKLVSTIYQLYSLRKHINNSSLPLEQRKELAAVAQRLQVKKRSWFRSFFSAIANLLSGYGFITSYGLYNKIKKESEGLNNLSPESPKSFPSSVNPQPPHDKEEKTQKKEKKAEEPQIAVQEPKKTQQSEPRTTTNSQKTPESPSSTYTPLQTLTAKSENSKKGLPTSLQEPASTTAEAQPTIAAPQPMAAAKTSATVEIVQPTKGESSERMDLPAKEKPSAQAETIQSEEAQPSAKKPTVKDITSSFEAKAQTPLSANQSAKKASSMTMQEQPTSIRIEESSPAEGTSEQITTAPALEGTSTPSRAAQLKEVLQPVQPAVNLANKEEKAAVSVSPSTESQEATTEPVVKPTKERTPIPKPSFQMSETAPPLPPRPLLPNESLKTETLASKQPQLQEAELKIQKALRGEFAFLLAKKKSLTRTDRKNFKEKFEKRNVEDLGKYDVLHFDTPNSPSSAWIQFIFETLLEAKNLKKFIKALVFNSHSDQAFLNLAQGALVLKTQDQVLYMRKILKYYHAKGTFNQTSLSSIAPEQNKHLLRTFILACLDFRDEKGKSYLQTISQTPQWIVETLQDKKFQKELTENRRQKLVEWAENASPPTDEAIQNAVKTLKEAFSKKKPS